MRILFVFAFLFVQATFSANMEAKKALIVTIDQKTLGMHAGKIEDQGAGALKTVLTPMKSHGALGEAIALLLEEIDSKTLIQAWDDARALWIQTSAARIYDKIFIIRGDDTRNDGYMAAIWDQALTGYDMVDYVSLVHGGGQIIKDEWNVPKSTNKIRMVYTEACGGGSGKNHFAKDFGALVSAGHNDKTPHPSASPLFSFTFLQCWFNGLSFLESLQNAWRFGSMMLHHPQGFALANFVANYQTKEDALEGSIIKLSWHAEVDPAAITINTDRGARIDGDVLEDVIK